MQKRIISLSLILIFSLLCSTMTFANMDKLGSKDETIIKELIEDYLNKNYDSLKSN
ncbi:hypothetical protein [Dethiothermospora halolimnae]|uniref:hypothetical protein n=1 Tax=Dethiothermospora halolimnae TaxID=3114390 RepID=UPI003CCBC851